MNLSSLLPERGGNEEGIVVLVAKRSSMLDLIFDDATLALFMSTPPGFCLHGLTRAADSLE